ncbi:lysine-specific demethylase lid isoform X2 [Nilaparvata lugens]|uniref:lysine-specific demethylase lid isoform X2 n=1 Tax=Nilaparvata lugens TaxID=108931 RepID=UPI00193CF92C|nr:lysine-specific demethylase lid isoform X2 [Nilaparvata lugens]
MEKGDSRAFFARTCVEYCLKAQNQVPDLNPPENPSSFIKPIEAPTFHPTKDEFSDPIAYINSVRPLAEQFGICKVVPPPGVTFPLSLPVDTYNFSTRLQHLNRIDAVAKSRSIFLGRLSKFYQLRGFALETPTLEFRKVDLYSLHHAVEKEGGYNEVCKKYKWEEVAKELDYKHFETIALALLEVYYTIIHPYVMVVKASDAFHSLIVEGMTQEPKAEIHAVNMSSYDKERIKCVDLQILEASIKLGEERRNVEELHNVEELPAQEQETNDKVKELEEMYLTTGYHAEFEELDIDQNLFKNPKDLLTRRGTKRNSTHSTQHESKSKMSKADGTTNDDFLFKIPGLPISTLKLKIQAKNRLKRLKKLLRKSLEKERKAKRMRDKLKFRMNKKQRKAALRKECEACKQQINQILLDCAYCKKSFHIKCIIPEMYQVPKGKWHCTPCIAMELKHTPDTFKQAFDHCEKQYHINEFQEMAETAKKKFFPLMNGEYPTSEMVEQRFWEIVGSENTMVDTVVEYGADLTSEHGTGFPSHASARTEAKPKKRAVYERFVEHPWNLNNIAACATSALKYIDEPISGMQIPWMYIGMIFSTFCWHNEDHWCYSINHLHLGDVKTWYSVPGQYAEKFEETVKELAPELFEAQPDTLQLLDTLVNPNALMKKGVPVYRMDQKAGEFMITFPRAYHCGFNQGFNLAEAVNFAPADWIKMGRRCVEEYSLLKRNNVFSHDELMFKIAEHAADADVRIAAAAYHDLYYAVKSELKLRQFVVSQWGAEELGMRFRFERFPDDDRQCVHCKTTVYLSAVICKCSADVQRMVCIKHYDKLCTKCKPQEHCLILKHTAEQMHELFKNLLDVVDPYEKWVKRMRFLFRQNAQLGDCIKQGMKSLLKEAKQKSYMSQQFFHNIKEVIKFVLFAPTCCLTVYGKAIITSDSEAFMYLVHFVEHILDVGHYSLCSNTVFKICKCLTDFKYAHYDESINEPDHQSESSSSSECESDSRSESASSSYSVSDRQKASCSYSVSDRQKASCSYSVSDRQKASCSYSVSDRQKASCSYSVSDRQKASCSYSVSDRQKASCSYSVSDRQTPSCSYSVSDRQKASCSYSASARKSAPRNVESDSEYEYHSESDSDSD